MVNDEALKQMDDLEIRNTLGMYGSGIEALTGNPLVEGEAAEEHLLIAQANLIAAKRDIMERREAKTAQAHREGG